MTGTLERGLVVGIVLTLTLAACGGGVSNEERFCEIDSEMTEIGDFLHPDPDEARRASLRVRELLAEAVQVAPEAIDSSVQVVADGLNLLIDLLEDADFHEENMDSNQVLEAISVNTFAAASETLDRWTDVNCSA